CVAGVRGDVLLGPVGERVCARTHQGQAPALEVWGQLGDCRLEIGPGLGGAGADAGDDLDRRLEQLVLRLGVRVVGVPPAHLGQDLGGAVVELTGLGVDDLELHLDAEAGALRRVEVDLHGPSRRARQSYGRSYPLSGGGSPTSSAARAVCASKRGWARV